MSFDRRRFLQLAAGWLLAVPGRRASGTQVVTGSLAARVHRQTRNTRTSFLKQLWPSGPRPRRAKPYVGLPRVPLPLVMSEGARLSDVVRAFAPADALVHTPLSLEALGRLLHLTNGITLPEPFPLRAAPSAGALYAGEVYVVAERVTGLEPGVYSYHVPTHRLARLVRGSHSDVVAGAVERPAAIESAPAFVLLTNVFFRYTHRYRERGYRYALIDTGHIGENLRLAAAEEGLGIVSPLRFHDDALNALLQIDGRKEAVCALHAIGAPAVSGERPVVRSFVETGPSALGLRECEAFHAATKLVPGKATAVPVAPTRAVTRQARVLPQRESPTATASWAIAERRSAERFLDEKIALADLSFLLDLARGNAAASLAPGIELRVVAHRVAGLPPGLYRHVPGAGLAHARTGDLREAMLDACLGQDKAESAAVGFAMVADLERASTAGDRPYRDLLIEAGAVAQRLYLAAEAIGLAARNLAAFYDDDLNALIGVDGKREAVVHLTMVGAGN